MTATKTLADAGKENRLKLAGMRKVRKAVEQSHEVIKELADAADQMADAVGVLRIAADALRESANKLRFAVVHARGVVTGIKDGE